MSTPPCPRTRPPAARAGRDLAAGTCSTSTDGRSSSTSSTPRPRRWRSPESRPRRPLPGCGPAGAGRVRGGVPTARTPLRRRGQDRGGGRRPPCRRLDLHSPAGLRRPRILDAVPRPRHAAAGSTRTTAGRADAPVVLCPVELRRSAAHSSRTTVRAQRRRRRGQPGAAPPPGEGVRHHGCRDLELDEPDVGSRHRRSRHAGPRPGGVGGRSDRTVLTTFSFHKEAIYRDLEDHEGSVVASPRSSGSSRSARTRPRRRLRPSTHPGDVGSHRRRASRPRSSSASSTPTRHSARASSRPARAAASSWTARPGTGKSQTIANIVAELVTMGRRVLFVSEKAAALDVVRDRLTSKGLGDFLLELHSHSATRKEVVKQLNKALTYPCSGEGELTDSEKGALQRTRQELSAFCRRPSTRHARSGPKPARGPRTARSPRSVSHKPIDASRAPGPA